MKIGITTFGCDHGKSGIGRYLSSLLSEFVAENRSPKLLSSPRDRAMLPHGLETEESPLFWDSPLPNLLLHQTWVPWKSEDFDVLFLPAANRRVPLHCPCPMVGTVHDLAVARLKGKFDGARSFYIRRVLPKLLRRLEHIVTVSEHSKNDILQLTDISSEKISVVPLGVDHSHYYPRRGESVLGEALGIFGPYFLYVSRIEHPGKNHAQLLLAFDQLKREYNIPHQLLLVGADWKGAEKVHRLAESLPSYKDIRFLGFCPEHLLPYLYSHAEALVFPSLYEGFGLPVLEAMACRTPVLASNRASLPEVVGTAGLLFSPDNPGALAAKLLLLLENRKLRNRLALQGRLRSLQFHWNQTAVSTLQILEAVARGEQPETERGTLPCLPDWNSSECKLPGGFKFQASKS